MILPVWAFSYEMYGGLWYIHVAEGTGRRFVHFELDVGEFDSFGRELLVEVRLRDSPEKSAAFFNPLPPQTNPLPPLTNPLPP